MTPTEQPQRVRFVPVGWWTWRRIVAALIAWEVIMAALLAIVLARLIGGGL